MLVIQGPTGSRQVGVCSNTSRQLAATRDAASVIGDLLVELSRDVNVVVRRQDRYRYSKAFAPGVPYHAPVTRIV